MIRRIKEEERRQLQRLINPQATNDAIAAYYAINHPYAQVSIYAAFANSEIPTGFMCLARTGMDLFRPLLVPFVGSQATFSDLLNHIIKIDFPFLFHLPAHQLDWMSGLQAEVLRSTQTYRLESGMFRPVLNVLVVENESPGGLPRFEILRDGRVMAAAGINWQGEHYADIYLDVPASGGTLAHKISVVSAVCKYLLSVRRFPLFRLEPEETILKHALQELGFSETGDRSLLGQAIRPASAKVQ